MALESPEMATNNAALQLHKSVKGRKQLASELLEVMRLFDPHQLPLLQKMLRLQIKSKCKALQMYGKFT